MANDNDVSEVEKGRAVEQQLRIWDVLLEIRIRVQKLLVEANKLPQDKEYWLSCEALTVANSVKANSSPDSVKSISKLLEKLLELKDGLTLANSETRAVLSRTPAKGKLDDGDDQATSSNDDEEEQSNIELEVSDDDSAAETEGDSDGTSEKRHIHKPRSRKRRLEIEDYEVEMKKKHESFIHYRNQVIKKWNDRTQLASGKLSKYTFSAFQTSTLKQIEQIMGDKRRLVRRTQLKRTQYDIIGKNKESAEKLQGEDGEGNYDAEIFDDDDFYHQMLRELIERKTSNITDPIQLSRHWLELQKLRSKTKRKIDTKASKARKLRYEVYPKLINLMAPKDETPITEHALKELFASLFGSTKV